MLDSGFDTQDNSRFSSNFTIDSSSIIGNEPNDLDKDLFGESKEVGGILITTDLVNLDNSNHGYFANDLSLELDITGKAVEQVQSLLTGLEADAVLTDKLELAFGETFKSEIADKLIENFGKDNFSEIPEIKIVSGDKINGANGGYDSLNGLIYLSRDFVNTHQNDVNAITGVILEEVGHFIDSRINDVDAAGDEGELFSALVQGKTLSDAEIIAIKAEDDAGTITTDGQEIEIEYSNASSSKADPNGSIYTADTLGTLNKSLRASGKIGYNTSYGKDRNDFWKFSVNSTREFSLSLTEGSRNADIAVYNSSGKLLQYSGKSFKQWLGKGDYYALVYNYSNPGTSYKLDLSAGRYLSQYVDDYSVRNAVFSGLKDGFIDRTDMMSILRSSKDYGSVNGYEVKDLRKIVGNAKSFGMAEHVRVLSSKVVYGNVANKLYRGSTLGNLYAGSNSTHMEKLVGKWFLGNDRPSIDSGYTYKFTQGSLFQNGISYTDIKQGNLANCYYVAGLAANAFRSPNTIKDMFTDNGDNTYTVRLFNNGVADYVTVDRYLPTNSYGNLVYATKSKDYNSSSNELWVALAEKAYAQLNESGWIGQDGTNSYKGIEYGWAQKSLEHINGGKFTSKGININNIINTFNKGEMITLSSKGDKKTEQDKDIVGNHVYVMTGYNYSTGTFKLYNPWGSTVVLSYNQIREHFKQWNHKVA